MPKRTSRSNMKTKNIYSAHAGDETEFGFIEMPANINGGVAQVTKCYFGEYKKGANKGEKYFMAIATGIEPSEARGATIQLMEALCKTTNQKGETTSEEDHVSTIMNEMRKLGADTSEVTSLNDLEQISQAIQDTAPYVKFATSQGEPTKDYPNPRIWHNWNGFIEDYEQTESDDVEEDVGDLPEHGETPPEDEVPFDTNDINSLAEAADEGTESAAEKLSELAASAGIDDDEVAGTKDWAQVADMIAKASNEEEEEEDDWEPKKGEVCKFKPPRARRSVEVTITAVFKPKRTCNLKDLENNKTYKAVSWDKLETDD